MSRMDAARARQWSIESGRYQASMAGPGAPGVIPLLVRGWLTLKFGGSTTQHSQGVRESRGKHQRCMTLVRRVKFLGHARAGRY